MIQVSSDDEIEAVEVDESKIVINDEDEDEEAIIEKRRKERQALLNKLAKKPKFEKISASAEIEDDRRSDEDEEPVKPVVADNPHHEWKSLKMASTRCETTTFDMFADDDEENEKAISKNKEDQTIMASNDNPNLTDNWDDAEGYYRYNNKVSCHLFLNCAL